LVIPPRPPLLQILTHRAEKPGWLQVVAKFISFNLPNPVIFPKYHPAAFTEGR